MLDYNHTSILTENINRLIDEALETQHATQVPRTYLGASRLGVACRRVLQFEYTNAPKDQGKGFNGKTLRIFQAGHVFEDLAIAWLQECGFELATTDEQGEQFGFSTAEGSIQGHVDGIIYNAPEALGLSFPMLWECKSLNSRSWKDTVKRGVAISKPIYTAQMALYQAYMEASVPGIASNPALFTAINKDTAEIHHELVPFDSALAQSMSDKGVAIIKATEVGELLPPISKDPAYFECRMCAWAQRCHRLQSDLGAHD